MNKKSKQQASKNQYGTLTAKFDANGEYGASSVKSSTSKSQNQTSKSEYGTFTAKSDVNNDYK